MSPYQRRLMDHNSIVLHMSRDHLHYPRHLSKYDVRGHASTDRMVFRLQIILQIFT